MTKQELERKLNSRKPSERLEANLYRFPEMAANYAGDTEAGITDWLVDMRHYCDFHELEFSDFLVQSGRMYDAECAELVAEKEGHPL